MVDFHPYFIGPPANQVAFYLCDENPGPGWKKYHYSKYDSKINQSTDCFVWCHNKTVFDWLINYWNGLSSRYRYQEI